jgi:hypothetical protein
MLNFSKIWTLPLNCENVFQIVFSCEIEHIFHKIPALAKVQMFHPSAGRQISNATWSPPGLTIC